MAELQKVRTAEETEGCEAGLPDDPVDAAIAKAKQDALELTRSTIRGLLDAASEENVLRVLRAVENVASNQRDLIGALKGRKSRRKRRAPGYVRAMGEYLPDDDDDFDDEGPAAGALVGMRSADNETFGANVMRQLIGFFRGPAEGLELKGLIEARRAALNADDADLAAEIKKKIDALLGNADDSPPALEGRMDYGYQAGNLVEVLDDLPDVPREAVGRVADVIGEGPATVLRIDFGGEVGEKVLAANRVSLHVGGPDTPLYGEELAAEKATLCAADCGRVLPADYQRQGKTLCPECEAEFGAYLESKEKGQSDEVDHDAFDETVQPNMGIGVAGPRAGVQPEVEDEEDRTIDDGDVASDESFRVEGVVSSVSDMDRWERGPERS